MPSRHSKAKHSKSSHRGQRRDPDEEHQAYRTAYQVEGDYENYDTATPRAYVELPDLSTLRIKDNQEYGSPAAPNISNQNDEYTSSTHYNSINYPDYSQHSEVTPQSYGAEWDGADDHGSHQVSQCPGSDVADDKCEESEERDTIYGVDAYSESLDKRDALKQSRHSRKERGKGKGKGKEVVNDDPTFQNPEDYYAEGSGVATGYNTSAPPVDYGDDGSHPNSGDDHWGNAGQIASIIDTAASQGPLLNKSTQMTGGIDQTSGYDEDEFQQARLESLAAYYGDRQGEPSTAQYPPYEGYANLPATGHASSANFPIQQPQVSTQLPYPEETSLATGYVIPSITEKPKAKDPREEGSSLLIVPGS
ncbi:uncharacterized protein JN550_008699 [Neoarthrinium moseri]|uniref:uncharacterized protein n=1 Tax=Neoarthrinium moseri TaxID=1658444 RepID=UPI001FDD1588|nr:uncharacterized protein JN550_008699 [Neoarthrinium moseri]KAI1864879.1 hypothetical protein JN550_008699 [Neoarthrinium moseri]